jgi:hypothetical protein
LLTVPALAQEVTGTIVGTVTDPSGGAVPRAAVIVTATDKHQVVRRLTSDSNGEYVATFLPVGVYSITADAKGFKSLVRTGIQLDVDQKLTVPLRLEVGDVSEKVTVESNVPAVELQSAVASGLISGSEVRELSLNNRNYLELLTIMPGVTSNSPTDELSIGATNPTGAVNALPFSVNGGRTTGNNFMLDGADNMDHGANQTLLNTPSVDAIAEFVALRGNYSAEYGRSAAGVVNVITKSGSSQFHGDVYEFFRNDKLASNNFFNNANDIARPPLRYNNFGYTFSGPVYIPGHYNRDKNKTFFFWSEEFRRTITYSTDQVLAPTAAMKSGVFSSPVCVQYTSTADTTCQTTASSITNINPVAAEYLQDVYSKVPAGNPTTFSLYETGRNTYNFRQELIKLDQTLSAKHVLSFRYVQDAVNTTESGGYQVSASSYFPGVSNTATQTPGHNAILRLTSSFSPSFINEAGAAYTKGAKLSQPAGLNADVNSPDVKVNLPYASTLGRLPTLSVANLTSITGYGPYLDYSYNYNAFDNATKVMGRHTLKFGVTYNYYRKTENQATSNAGTFTFSNTTAPKGTPQAMQNFANFLLGNVTTFTQGSLDLTPDMRQREFETYVQDDFRVRSNLTINLGVRLSIYRLPYDDRHMLTNFDPNLFNPANAPQVDKTTGNVITGTGNPLNGIVQNGNSLFGNTVSNQPDPGWAPRVGLAWDPFGTGKTSVRAGYGISYDSSLVGMYENNIFTNPPFLDTITISNTLLSNPSAGVSVISAAPKTLRGTPTPVLLPYTQQYSFDVQRQFAGNFVLDAGYYGSKSTHLLGIVDLNEVAPGLAVADGITTANAPLKSSTEVLLNSIRPYRGYGPINVTENWFNANYSSLQVSAIKRLKRSSTLRLAYSWSKTMTGVPNDRTNAPLDTYDRAADYGLAPFNRTQVLTMSYVYEIPFDRAAPSWVRDTLHGWQISGITSFATGLPLTVTSSYGIDWGDMGILSGSLAAERPEQFSNPNTNAPHTIAQWFNTSAFGPVPTGIVAPGNAGVSTIQGPGYEQWDVSLFRNLQFSDRFRMQIRGETFNLLNHTNPMAVSVGADSTTFGQVTSTRDPRRIQLGMKLLF